MKKIPTLFERVFENHKIIDIRNNVCPGMEWVLNGEGVATVKFDGICCAIIDGEFYRRYDAKKGKKPPYGAIPCCEADPITGHHPHWIKVSADNPNDKWLMKAYNEYVFNKEDGTYEAVGPHFQTNPYELDHDILIPHGLITIDVPRSFDGIKQYLCDNHMEGIVFWKDGEPRCKIKRTDFGFKWPIVFGDM